MIRPIIMLCAEGVIRDGETNGISIFNIMEQVNGIGFPLLIPKLATFILFERDLQDPSTVDCEITLRNNDTVISTAPVHVNFQDKTRNRTILTIIGIPIQNPGSLTVTLTQQQQNIGSYKIDIINTRPPIQTQAAS